MVKTGLKRQQSSNIRLLTFKYMCVLWALRVMSFRLGAPKCPVVVVPVVVVVVVAVAVNLVSFQAMVLHVFVYLVCLMFISNCGWVIFAGTRSFPGADIGSGHYLLMKAFHLRLKRISKSKHTRLKFDLGAERSPWVGNLPSYHRREVFTSHHHE